MVKLAGNFLLASAIEALAEALTLAEKNGIDRTKLASMFGQTLFACRPIRPMEKRSRRSATSRLALRCRWD